LADSSRTGVLIAFAGAFLLSFDTLLLRMIGAEPLQMAFWRGLSMFAAGCAALFILKVVRPHADLRMLNGKTGVTVAWFYGIASISFVASAMMTSIANMLLIIATAPFWAAILAIVILNERPSRATLVACGVAFSGMLVVAWPGLRGGINAGDAIALVAALSMACAFVVSRRTRANLALAPALGGLMSAIVLMPFVGGFWLGSWQSMVLMGVEGLLLVPLALDLLAMAPRYLPAPRVGLFLLLETVLGPLWIWAVLAEAPTAYALSGGLIVVATLALHSLYSMRRWRRFAAAPKH